MADSVNGLNIPSIQNNKPVNFQQTVVTTPMQGVPVNSDALKQAANDNYISNRVKASEGDNPAAKLGIGMAIWYALAQLMDKVNPKMGGKFEESLGGKVASVGDRLSNTYLGKKFENFIGWFDRKTTAAAEKSQIVNSLKNHSTSPEWGFAKMPAKGLFGFWSADAEQVLQQYLKPIDTNVQKLEQYAIPQKEIDDFAKTLKGRSKLEQQLLIQEKELTAIGADAKVVNRLNSLADRAAKSALESLKDAPEYSKLLENATNAKRLEILQKYAQKLKLRDIGGFKTVAEFEKFKFIDHPERAIDIFENLAEKHPDWKVSIWRNKTSVPSNKVIAFIGKVLKAIIGENAAGKVVKFLNKLNSHLLGRTVGFTEYRNKGLIAAGKGGASRLGRFMSKSLGWIQEGATNRFGGGKVAVLMQAFIFADMVMATIKAPWKEKFQTAAERLVNDFSYFVGLTIGLIGMHKIGGFKYAGLKDAAAVGKYRDALKALNAKNDAGLFASKKEWKQAVKELNKKMLGKENIKNPITKLLQKIGTFVNIGNERVHSYKSTAKWNLNWLRKIKNGNIIGVPLRIWLGMGVAVPFIAKWATKGVHAIIGRPTHSVLDEEEEEIAPEKAQPSQQAQPSVQTTGTTPVISSAPAPQYKSPQDYKSDTNLIKQAMSGKPAFQGALNTPQDHPTVEDYKKLYADSNYVKQTLNGQYPPSQAQNNAAATAGHNADGLQHPTAQEYQNYPDSNYVKMTLNGQYPPSGNTVNNTTIVNGQQTNGELEPKRTYIPSPDSKVTNNVDLTAAEKALADADNAEKFINDTLSKMN